MDNINLLQLIMSDGVFSLELLALFTVGFYLIISMIKFPNRAISLPVYSNTLRVKRPDLQIGFDFATIIGVGAVVSPARTWLRQNSTRRN